MVIPDLCVSGATCRDRLLPLLADAEPTAAAAYPVELGGRGLELEPPDDVLCACIKTEVIIIANTDSIFKKWFLKYGLY